MRLRDVALVGAACDSPTAAHRLPTLTKAFGRALAGEVPRSGGLQAVLDAVDAAHPDLALTEDWWPSDCRLTVTVRHAGQRWRLHPGRHNAPADLVRVLQDTSASIDRACRAAHGFGASDLLEVALRYIDAAVENAAPSWPDGSRGGPPLDERAQTRPDWFGAKVRATPVEVSEPEVDAARRWWASDRLAAVAGACTDPRAAARAVAWATSADAASDQPSLALRAKGRRWAWPGSLMLSRVQDCIVALAEDYASAETDLALRRSAALQVHGLLDAKTFDLDPVEPPTPPPTWPGYEPPMRGSAPPAQPASVSAAAEPPVGDETPTSAMDQDETDDPDQVAYAGRRLITFDTVAVSRVSDTQQTLQDVDRRIRQRDLDLLRQRLGVPDRTEVVPVPVVLTHGVVDVHVMHTGGFAVLPVAVLRQILRAADAHPGGRDLAWQFLEELCHLPRQIDRVLPAAAEDIWAHWLRQGGLLPPAAPPRVEHADLLITPMLYDPTWPQAAALDGVTALADRAALPDLNDLPSVEVDSDGRVTAWGLQSGQVVCLGVPATAVVAETAGWRTAADVDATLLPALATGLRDALCDSGLGQAMSAADGVYRLEVRVEQDPDSEAALHIGLAGHPDGAWELRLGLHVLQGALDAPERLHRALGALLARPHEGRPGVDEALGRWRELRPLLIVTAEPSTAYPSPAGTLLEPTAASRNWASQAVMTSLDQGQPVPPGRHYGDAARRYARDVYLPAAIDALHRAASAYDRTKLLTSAVRAADGAHAERARRRGWLDIGLGTAHAARVRERALTSPDDAALTRPAEMLVEELLAVPSAGDLRPDRFDMAELTGIAELAMTAGIGCDLASRGLADLVVHAGEDGAVAVAVTQTYKPSDTGDDQAGQASSWAVSPARWLAAHRAEGLAEPADPSEADAPPRPKGTSAASRPRPVDGDDPSDAEPDGQPQWRPLLEGPDVPGRLARLDQVMVKHLGWGIEDLFLILATAAHGDRTFVPAMPPAQLADQATALSGRPTGGLNAVIDFLTFTPGAAAADRRFWEQERRPHRLFLRPFVQLPNGDILVPRHLADALYDVTAHMLGEGRLTWPGLPGQVDQAANNFRQTATKALERQASEQATAAGLPCAAGIEQHQAARAGIPNLTGEIDLLACDPDAGVLWVVEAKHHIESASAYAISHRAQRFLKKGGYVDTLLAKAAVVQAHADQAAALVLGNDGQRPGGWDVRPVMATARVEPAAFTDSTPRVPFVLVRRLGHYLSTGEGAYGT